MIIFRMRLWEGWMDRSRSCESKKQSLLLIRKMRVVQGDATT
jgi:hypothetical protein